MNVRHAVPDGPEYDAARANNEQQRCGNCRYFNGCCKRHAPVITSERELSRWPYVDAFNWCGDFEFAPFADTPAEAAVALSRLILREAPTNG